MMKKIIAGICIAAIGIFAAIKGAKNIKLVFICIAIGVILIAWELLARYVKKAKEKKAHEEFVAKYGDLTKEELLKVIDICSDFSDDDTKDDEEN